MNKLTIAFVVLFMLLALTIGCTSEKNNIDNLVEKEANTQEKELDNLLTQLSERESLNSSELDSLMRDIGMERIIGIPETSNFTNSKNQLEPNIRLNTRVYQKADYIYIDFIIDSDKVLGETILETYYDQVDVYTLEEYLSPSLYKKDALITLNNNEDEEVWFAYLLRMRSKVDKAAITYAINMKTMNSKYFWNYSIVTNQR